MAGNEQAKALLVDAQRGDRMLQEDEQARAPGGNRPQFSRPVIKGGPGLCRASVADRVVSALGWGRGEVKGGLNIPKLCRWLFHLAFFCRNSFFSFSDPRRSTFELQRGLG